MSANAHQIAPLGLDIESRLSCIDQPKMRRDRLTKLRAELARRDYAAALLSDPINIRYASGSRNMAVWTMHAPGRYLFVPVDGPVVMFEFQASKHLAEKLDTIDELRTSIPWFHFLSGPRTAEKTSLWAQEIIALMRQYGRTNQRLAVDRCEPWGAKILTDNGIVLFDAQEPIEFARLIKTPEEMGAMELSMDVCDIAVERLRQSLRPGITENQAWSVLHDTNIIHDGEWIECRLLASSPANSSCSIRTWSDLWAILPTFLERMFARDAVRPPSRELCTASRWNSSAITSALFDRASHSASFRRNPGLFRHNSRKTAT
jgi:Xaa-Pro aminopeptidase